MKINKIRIFRVGLSTKNGTFPTVELPSTMKNQELNLNTECIHPMAGRMHCLSSLGLGNGEKMGKTLQILVLSLFLGLASSQKAQAENGEVLFGAAAITGAVSAMVVPGIMAQSQQNIAQINAQTSTTISQMNAQQSLFQARLQSQMALANAASSLQIAGYNQQSQTRDLLSQLQFLAYNRALDNEMAKMRMAQQLELQNNLMALEFKKMELNQVLAEANALAGGRGGPVSVTPNINNILPVNPGGPTSTLSASLGANAQLSDSQSNLSAQQASLGLRRALTRSLSSGSTLSDRRTIGRDLTNMINSTATDASQEFISRRALNRSRSISSHHQR